MGAPISEPSAPQHGCVMFESVCVHTHVDMHMPECVQVREKERVIKDTQDYSTFSTNMSISSLQVQRAGLP